MKPIAVRELLRHGAHVSDRHFGLPRFGLFAFFWAVVQPLRAVWWLLRFQELRALSVIPVVLTLTIGAAMQVFSFMAAAPLHELLMTHGQGLLGSAAWISSRVLIHVVLAPKRMLAPSLSVSVPTLSSSLKVAMVASAGSCGPSPPDGGGGSDGGFDGGGFLKRSNSPMARGGHTTGCNEADRRA